MTRQYSVAKAFAGLLGKKGTLEAPEFDRHCEVAQVSNEAYFRSYSDLPSRSSVPMPGSQAGAREQRFFCPYDEIFHRDLEAGNTGGQTIAKYPPALYKSLQPNSIAGRCTWLTGLRGNLPIVDATPAPTNWPGELGTINESDQTFTQNVMTPFLLSGQLKITKQLLLTATAGSDLYLRQELTRSIFAQLGGAVLIGAGPGSNQPVGVLNTPSVNAVTLGTPTTWLEIVDCEVSAATANVTDFTDFVYVVTPAQLGLQKTTERGSGLSSFLTNDDGKTNGFDTLPTTILGTSAKLISGPLNLIMLGIWGSGVEILIDQWTGMANGLVIVTIYLFADVLVRYPGAFTIGN
jgi:Phage capsid family